MAETPISAAFRFSPEVIAELDRKRGDLTRTEFVRRCIMDGTAPASVEERLAKLEARVQALELGPVAGPYGS